MRSHLILSTAFWIALFAFNAVAQAVLPDPKRSEQAEEPAESGESSTENSGGDRLDSASAGEVLTNEVVTALPLVDGDVLSLIKVMPGVYGNPGELNPIQSFAGISGHYVNTVRDGLSVSSGQYPLGVFSETVINPELVEEMRVIVAPVDAEYGRGNGQVQIRTRSGTDTFRGEAVWRVRNSALDANTWELNRNPGAPAPSALGGDSAQPDWTNQHHFTLSGGGPVVRNRTYVFALWDQQIHAARELVETEVLTDAARNGVFRYMDGWASGHAASPTSGQTTAAVDYFGKPLVPVTNPNGSPYSGQGLMCFSVFGEFKADGTPFTPADCPGGTIVSSIDRTGMPWWDPKRPSADPTGWTSRFIDIMPPATDFTGGDGLNTAIHRWVRGGNGTGPDFATFFGTNPVSTRKQFNAKVDHRVNGGNQLTVGITIERTVGGTTLSNWPNGFHGVTSRRPSTATINWTASPSPRILSEFRFGMIRSRSEVRQAWDSPDEATRNAAREFWVENESGQQAVFYPAGFSEEDSPFPGRRNLRDAYTMVTIGETLSWIRNVHSVRFGGELRLARSKQAMGSPLNSSIPVVRGGAGGQPAFGITGFGSAGQPGLHSSNESPARELLYLLAGSVDGASQYYWVDEAGDVEAGRWESFYSTEASGYSDEYGAYDYQTEIQNEAAFFLKDDWAISNSLTLNLGLRWEYYGVPRLDNGLTVALEGQGLGLFGVSRTGKEDQDPFSYWLTPGDVFLSGYGPNGALECVSGVSNGPGMPVSNCDPTFLSTPRFVGPGTSRPSESLYRRDLNNWGPAAGFSWRPFNQWVVRGGYQLTHGGSDRSSTDFRTLGSADLGMTLQAQTNLSDALARTPNDYLDLSALDAVIPVDPELHPGRTVPVTGLLRNARAADPNLSTPYVQNFTLSLQRELSPRATVEVRYVGTQGKKLLGEIDLNTPDVFLNPELLEALEITRNGGDAPLLDQMLVGLDLQPFFRPGYDPVGTTNSDGVLQTGSLHLRSWFPFARQFARGDYAAIAELLSTDNRTGLASVSGFLPSPFPGLHRILRNGCDRMAGGARTIGDVTGESNELSDVPLRCFPENYIAANPQFWGATYATNSGSSSYHSFQLRFALRPWNGTTVTATYAWSKTMEIPTRSYTDPLNRRADLRLASNHRSHDFRMYGVLAFPVGPGQPLLSESRGLLSHAVGGWQLGWIFNAWSGTPLTLGGLDSLHGNGTPDVIGAWDVRGGDVVWGVPSGSQVGGSYFGEGRFTKVPDPICQEGGPLDYVDRMGFSLMNSCTAMAIADARTGGILLQNASPGRRGTLGQTTVSGPGFWDFDLSLSKEFSIDDRRSLYVRVDATNVLNHPSPNSPNVDINSSLPFGFISGKTGNRQFRAQLRLTF